MRYPAVILTITLLLLSACSQEDEASYTPPRYTATVYALAASDHIAVLHLKDNKLEQIKLDREGADLATVDGRLFILSTDGAVAEIRNLIVGKWTRVSDHGVSLAMKDKNTLLVLGRTEICLYKPGSGVKQRVALKKRASAISFDRQKNLIWAIDRKGSRAFSLNGDSFKLVKKIDGIGNSPHHALSFPGTNEIWVAEGNEFMNGKPYGVGYAGNGVAASGGINVVDTINGRQTDFIIVGGNVVDLTLSADKKKIYVATSQYPEYLDATMTVVDPEQRRGKAEFRLCLYCHEEHNVEPKDGRAIVRAMAVVEPLVKPVSGKKP